MFYRVEFKDSKSIRGHRDFDNYDEAIGCAETAVLKYDDLPECNVAIYDVPDVDMNSFTVIYQTWQPDQKRFFVGELSSTGLPDIHNLIHYELEIGESEAGYVEASEQALYLMSEPLNKSVYVVVCMVDYKENEGKNKWHIIDPARDWYICALPNRLEGSETTNFAIPKNWAIL